jgi:hypothetical protein
MNIDAPSSSQTGYIAADRAFRRASLLWFRRRSGDRDDLERRATLMD